MKPAIYGKDISVAYQQNLIIPSMSVQIPKGKITSIIGPNGCGKSTLLKALSRMIPVRSGEVFLEGNSITQMPAVEVARRMAILPQSPQAPGGLTVQELVSYGRYPHQKGFGKLNKEDKDAIQWALELTKMQELAHRRVDALSGGQRQRISLARAILKNAPIIVLDEATAYADPENEEKMEAAIAELVKGKTLFVIAHKLPAIMNADQICVIEHGKLAATGTHAELLATCEEYKKLWKASQDSAEWKVNAVKEGK